MNGQRARGTGRGAAIIAALAFTGVAVAAATSASAGDGAGRAWAVLEDVDGDTVGFATFKEDATGRVHVNVHASSMSPGQHGIHVHEIGSCRSTPTTPFSGAGAHHNPHGAPHGDHAGDLPNLVVNAAGRGRLQGTLEHFSLDGEAAILGGDGSALVVHALPDDYVTQPTGGSGARIACGVVHAG